MDLEEESWRVLLEMENKNGGDKKKFLTTSMNDLLGVTKNIVSSGRKSEISQHDEEKEMTQEEKEFFGKRSIHGNKEFMYRGYRMFVMESKRKGFTKMEYFVRFMKLENIRTLVRTSSEEFRPEDEEELRASLVTIVELHFPEGQVPGEEVRQSWLEIFRRHGEMPRTGLAVHGFKRSGCLVAVGLIHAGMRCDKAIDTVKEKFPYELSSAQLKFLRQYKNVVTQKKSSLQVIKEQCSVL